ncbi:MAG: hypothetical protein NDI73_00555 [Desulfuromonadales bacterium]|nr:hypothetical protein [Desulfuromonadales bacterium]
MNMPAKNPLHLREAWVIFFVLGLVMLNFPFLHIFNKDVQVFGTPLIILYLMVGWPVSILVVYLFSRLLANASPEADDDNSPPPPQDQP